MPLCSRSSNASNIRRLLPLLPKLKLLKPHPRLDSLVNQIATSVASELQSFAGLRQTLSDDHSSFMATIEERLAKLHEDLAAENSLMDALAQKTTALKVKNLQLSNSQKEIESLRSEREVTSSCVSDVHDALSNILEAHDPILNYSVRRDIAEKLAPTLSLLSKIEGLLEFMSIPKQGGEDVSQPPPTSTATKTTEPPSTGKASGSGVKDKGKQIAEDSDDDKETIVDLLKKKGRDKDAVTPPYQNGGNVRGRRTSYSVS
ncbi:hypothetical protein Lser_V15G13428 [Lactuca serriola]